MFIHVWSPNWWSVSIFGCCSVAHSRPTLCNLVDCTTPGFPVAHHLLRFAQVHVDYFNDAIQQAISSSDALFFCPLSFPAWGTFPMSQLFMSDDENIRASASASILQWVFRVDFPEDWLVWSPCCPGEFQESSPAPQFKGTTSLAFCLLYCPALTTVHDHWEYYSLDYTDLRWQSNVSVFQHTV